MTVQVLDEYLVFPMLRCRHCREDRPHTVSGTFYLTCQACGTARCNDRYCHACEIGGRP